MTTDERRKKNPKTKVRRVGEKKGRAHPRRTVGGGGGLAYEARQRKAPPPRIGGGGGSVEEARTRKIRAPFLRNGGGGSDVAATAAAEAIGSNEDLILEILYRLPITSVLNFKAVSKSWKSFISDPLFPHRYSIRRPPPDSSVSAGFLFKPTRKNDYRFAPVNEAAAALDPSLFFAERSFRVLHSCNGLLLCEKSDQLDKDHTIVERPIHAQYYVCNPITNEFVQVRDERTFPIFSGLAFDPSKSPHYKVLVVERLQKGQPDARVHIYSSETRTWRYSNLSLLLPEFCSSGSYYHKVALWNGALHWAGKLQSTLSFDLQRECFWETTRPDGNSARWSCFRIVVSCGQLKLIESKRIMAVEYRILEMDDDCKQWIIKRCIDLRRLLQLNPKFMICPLHFFNGRRRESDEEEMLFHVPGKIISHRTRDSTCEDVCQVDPPSSYVLFLHLYSYTLSSVRPPLLSSS